MSFRPWFSSLSCQNYKYSVANIFFHYYFSRPVLFLLFFSVNSSYRLVLHLIIKYNLINLLMKENKMILPCKLGRRLLLILKKTHYTWGVFQNVFFRNIRFFKKKKSLQRLTLCVVNKVLSPWKNSLVITIFLVYHYLLSPRKNWRGVQFTFV